MASILSRLGRAVRATACGPPRSLAPLLLALGLAACGSATQASQRSSAPLVHLPADQASHPGAPNEWWYVVGHLQAGGRTFGYEVTLFRFHQVRLPGFSEPVTLDRTDVAITDEKTRRFYHRITYYFPQSADLSSQTLHVRVGHATLAGPSPRNMSLRAAIRPGSIDLHLSSQRPAMDVGGRGYLPFGDGYTYYYSLTDLATTGTITVAGETYRVTGISWLDHQWGAWSWQAVRGWTWMALQLDNGVQMSVFDFRSTASRVKAASVLLADGRLRTLRRASLTPVGTWRSPHTHALYPSGWVVRIPALRATLHVEPTVLDQEMTEPSEPRASYWEGSSRAKGTFLGKPVSGLGYTELTGYVTGSAK